MGEYADAMLDGTLCSGCGKYLGGEDIDAPLLCKDCAGDARQAGAKIERVGRFFFVNCGAELSISSPANGPLKMACPTCTRKVKVAGLADHMRDVHQNVTPIKVPCPTCGRKIKAAGLADHQRALHGAV